MADEGILRRDELVERDGILHLSRNGDPSAYRRRWEDEAAADHVRSAIAGGTEATLDLAALTAKTSPLWDRLPAEEHFGTVLEIGAGYGRIPLYLANERGASWSTYCAVDISENMLSRLREYDERFGRNPAAAVHAICVSADELPLEDDSVDLAISSAVFLHMGKSFVARAVSELARTLRPGGRFVFDVSFPNARNPAGLPSRLKPRRLRAPNFMKYWTRAEIETLLLESGLTEKAGGAVVEEAGWALLPKQVGPISVPLARRANAALGTPPQRLRGLLATTYSAYSSGFLAE